jgi:hypothetical protein
LLNPLFLFLFWGSSLSKILQRLALSKGKGLLFFNRPHSFSFLSRPAGKKKGKKKDSKIFTLQLI